MRRSLLIALAVALLPAAAAARITTGPYLMNAGKTSITVCFVTDDAAARTVTYFTAGEAPLSVQSAPEAFRIGDVRTDYHHHVPLYGLSPDTEYTYTVSDDGGARGPYRFLTAPPNTTPFRFAAYGDNRGGRLGAPNPRHLEVIEGILDWDPAFFLNTGDLVSGGEDYLQWDEFFLELGDLAPAAALVPSYGNHENGYDEELDLSGADNWARLFPLPEPGRHSRWYSFDYGNVHFSVLNMEEEWTFYLRGSPQRVWLEEDLTRAVNNPHTNLIVAVYHQPAFSWQPDRNPSFAASAIVAPLLKHYGVDLVLAGHNHHYARAVVRDVMHVTTGGGGASLYEFVEDVEQEPGYRAHALAYHYMIVDVDPRGLHVTAYGAPSGEVLDQFDIQARREVVPDNETPPDDDQADDDHADDDAADDTDDDQTDDDAGDAAAPSSDQDDEDGGGCLGF